MDPDNNQNFSEPESAEGPAIQCIEIISMDQLGDGGQIQWDRLAGSTLTIQALSGTTIDQYAPGQQVALQVIPMSQPDSGLVQQQAILGQLPSQVTQSTEEALQDASIKLLEDGGSVGQVQTSVGDLSHPTEASQKTTDLYNPQLTIDQCSKADEVSVTPVINFSPQIQNPTIHSLLKNVVPQTYVTSSQNSFNDITTNLGPGEHIFDPGQEKNVQSDTSFLSSKMVESNQSVIVSASSVDQTFLPGETPQDKLFSSDDIFSQENIEKLAVSGEEFGLQQVQEQALPGAPMLNGQGTSIKVFTSITATLSKSMQELLPSDKQTYLNEFQSCHSLDLHIAEEDGTIRISGTLQSIIAVYKELSVLVQSPDVAEDLMPVCDVEIQTELSRGVHTSNKSSMCDLLVPCVSTYGREIKHPSRYLGYLNLPSSTGLELENQDDEEDVKSPTKYVRKKRKPGRPKKVYTSHSRPGKQIECTKQDTSTAGQISAMQEPKMGETGAVELSAPLTDCLDQLLTGTKSSQSDGLEALNGSEQVSIPEAPSVWSEKVDQVTPSDKPTRESRPVQTRAQMLRKQYETLAPFKFFCNHCSFKTKRESHFTRHCKLHESNKELYGCKFCSFKTIRFSTLRRHELAHCSFVFECDECPYKTDSAPLLSKHINFKHVEKAKRKKAAEKLVYSCAVCDYTTVSTAHYRRHLRAHGHEIVGLSGSKLPSFLCNKCDYKTSRKEHFVRHMNDVHSEKRPYLCDLCGRGFKRSDALAQHMITHVEKSKRHYAFQCPLCSKGFRSRAHLNEHMSMHSSARTYLCHICGAAFKTRNVQRKHLQTIHMNPRSFNCEFCEKRFNTKYALQRHKQTHDMPSAPAATEQELTVTHSQMSEIEAQALQTIQTSQADLVQDVIPVAIDENYDQSSDSMRQTYMHPNEATTALIYLTNSLNSAF